MPDTTVRATQADAPDATPGATFRPLPPSPPPWRRLADLARVHLSGERPRWLTAAVVAAVIVVVVVALTVRASGGATAPPELSLPRAQTAPPADGARSASAGAAGADPTGTPPAASSASLVVHVAGAVVRTGVYSLPAGSRVNDAVAAAGGPAADADLDQLDLATHLTDGDRVYVPRRGEQAVPAAGVVGATAGGPATAAIVDINSADAEQLDALPGVGPSLAGAIVEYRRQHGRFRTVQDLLQVPGIGDAKLAALRSKVKVGP